MSKNFFKKYELGLIYDGKFYIAEVSAQNEEAAKEAIKAQINVAKEYQFTYIKEVEVMKSRSTGNSKKYYVAYGSNLHLGQMARRCPDSKVYGSGIIKNYRLVFYGVASIEKSKTDDCPVGVWEISERDELNLDRYEGYPNLYRKENIEVVMDNGEVIEAMVYIMNRSGQQSYPNQYYYDTILTGYHDFKLNTNYLKSVVARIPEEDYYGELASYT